MTQRILIMGLPGAGKTVLAKKLYDCIVASGATASWFNADLVREQHNDWDFSHEGRMRQGARMRTLADAAGTDYAICDFVAPLPEIRDKFSPDWVVWVDTIDESRYADTNKVFIPPTSCDFRITTQDSDTFPKFISTHILENRRRPIFDWKKETVQMLGRWQPWHKGHRALFERAIAKTGQVVIMIRDCQGWKNSNPFALEDVSKFIVRDLEPLYQGQYEILPVPNIVNITYGRDVGYTIEQEVFDESITSVSATQIRKDMGIE